MLASNVISPADIRADYTVIEYTNDSDKEMQVVARVDLAGIATGDYSIRLYINNTEVLPFGVLAVAASTTTVNSRSIILMEGETISVKVQGTPSDSAVLVAAYLVDSTPISREDIEANNQLLIDAMLDAIDMHLGEIEIRPEKTILGPCSKTVDPAGVR